MSQRSSKIKKYVKIHRTCVNRDSGVNLITDLRMDDVRIAGYDPLWPPPHLLKMELPLSDGGRETIGRTRRACTRILRRRGDQQKSTAAEMAPSDPGADIEIVENENDDDRLLVIVGPCSIHDPVAALDYGRRLAAVAADVQDAVLVVMRAYFEKPRTTVGVWFFIVSFEFHFHIGNGLNIGYHASA